MSNGTKRKKVLFYYLRGASAGGSDTCLLLLIKYLDRAKYEPVILYRDSSIFIEELKEIGYNLIPFPQKIKEKLYEHMKKSADVIANSKKDKSIKKKLVKKTGKLSIYLSNIKHLVKKAPETIQYVRLILKYKVDLVHTNHDITSDHPMILASLLLRKKTICHNRGLYTPMLLDVKLSKYVDKIICMSDFSKSVYLDSGVSGNKCETIYDGIDTENFKPSKRESDQVIISCIGRLEIWKGQQVLIDATELIAKKILNFKILLIGAGDNEKELRKQITEKHLEQYIEFTGHITNVKDYIEESTIIAHTSIVPEPFGMVITEAMALEKVVIATNFGGPKEIITHEKDGFLVPPENPEALAETIVKLINDPKLRSKISKNAREKVLTKFDVRTYAKQIEAVYERT